MASPSVSVELVPPLLADDVWCCKPTTEPVITAYFSRYFGHGPGASARALAQLVEADLPDMMLRIYAHPEDARQLADLDTDDGRILVHPFDRDAFLRDLARSRCLVANAGFNLIAEAALLGKPQLVIPLPTYDQHWCAQAVHDNHLGLSTGDVNRDSLLALLDRADDISDRAAALRDGYLAIDTRPLIGEYIEHLAASPADDAV
jgi:UDP:flavonoid glycosyltransferase YjiC (YdhE family)